MSAANSPMSILSTRPVCESFGAVQVLKNMELGICGGEVLALLDESVAGKPAPVRRLAGLEALASGACDLLTAPGSEQTPGWKRTKEQAEQYCSTDSTF